MSNEQEGSQNLIKLRRLWKGTLYIGIVAIYVVLVASAVMIADWQSGLLVFACITLSLVFRYVADEVDHIGWVLRNDEIKEGEYQETARIRRWLFGLLVLLVQLPNLALVGYVFVSFGLFWSALVLVLLALAEAFFLEIRRVNRKVSFREASYGFKDRPVAIVGSAIEAADPGRGAELSDKLSKLRELMKEGEISEKAYAKARDKYLVRHVMESQD